MNKEFYEKHYKFGRLASCLTIDLGYMAFGFKDFPQSDEDDKELHELPTRLIVFSPNKNKPGSFGVATWGSANEVFVSAADRKWIVSTEIFHINELMNKTSWYEIPNNEQGSLAKGLVNIDGNVYAYGMVRSVFKRTGIQQWENLTAETKHPSMWGDIKEKKERFFGNEVGFSALDGFTGDDLYAGGNQGDCWHYHKQQWRKVDLPLNSDIAAITCAPDDQVYVASRLGPVLKGRDNRWQTLDKFKEITHSAWFQNRIYFVAKSGLILTHNEGETELSEAKFAVDFPHHMHRLIRGIAACEECLVIYTDVQAYAWDGEIWHEIIELPALSKHNKANA